MKKPISSKKQGRRNGKEFKPKFSAGSRKIAHTKRSKGG